MAALVNDYMSQQCPSWIAPATVAVRSCGSIRSKIALADRELLLHAIAT